MKSTTEVDTVRKDNLADFEKKYSIDGYKQESTEAKNKTLMKLPFKLIELVKHIGIVAFLN